MILEVKAKYQVNKEKEVGEIRICDMCGKVIIDTTQIDDKFINNYPMIRYYVVETNEEMLHICSLPCVDQAYAKWRKQIDVAEDEDTQGNIKFEVRDFYLNQNNMLDKYIQNKDKELSLKEWNEIKRDAHVESENV